MTQSQNSASTSTFRNARCTLIFRVELPRANVATRLKSLRSTSVASSTKVESLKLRFSFRRRLRGNWRVRQTERNAGDHGFCGGLHLFRRNLVAIRDAVIPIQSTDIRLEVLGFPVEFEVRVGGEQFAKTRKVPCRRPGSRSSARHKIQKFPAQVGDERVTGRAIWNWTEESRSPF